MTLSLTLLLSLEMLIFMNTSSSTKVFFAPSSNSKLPLHLSYFSPLLFSYDESFPQFSSTNLENSASQYSNTPTDPLPVNSSTQDLSTNIVPSLRRSTRPYNPPKYLNAYIHDLPASHCVTTYV